VVFTSLEFFIAHSKSSFVVGALNFMLIEVRF